MRRYASKRLSVQAASEHGCEAPVNKRYQIVTWEASQAINNDRRYVRERKSDKKVLNSAGGSDMLPSWRGSIGFYGEDVL
jgi:hypothetical protein